jgi:hypothetical protein
MRYEFERDGAPVGAAQWEGPGQVALDMQDEKAKPEFTRFFAREEVYLGSGYAEADEDHGLSVRRRDWTPWEFERACKTFARQQGYRARRTPNAAVDQR